MSKQVFQSEENRRKTKKMLLYFGIFSMVMLFAGLTSAYIVSQADGFWVKITLPQSFTYSTITIVISSVTMWLAVKAVRTNQFKNAGLWLLVTLLLGLVFSYLQFNGWSDLYQRGHTFRGENIFLIKGEYGKDYTFMFKGEPLEQVDGEFYEKSDSLHEKPLRDAILGSRDVSSSYLVAITFIHFLHLLGGLLYLLYVIVSVFRTHPPHINILRTELCSTYWHFLGILWIYLFLFLLFIH